MRFIVRTIGETPVVRGVIEAQSLAEARRLASGAVEVLPDPRDMPLATFLRRIPRAKRIEFKTTRLTDADLNDALDLLYTYSEVSTDDQNIIDFATFLRTNGYLTLQQAQALLA